jgi:hypothetical protein
MGHIHHEVRLQQNSPFLHFMLKYTPPTSSTLEFMFLYESKVTRTCVGVCVGMTSSFCNMRFVKR